MGVLLRIGMALSLGVLALAARAGQDVETRLNQVMADPKARAVAVQAGKRAAFFCENCHGASGNSSLPHVPNLAGQNPVYLLTQIDKFGDGRRRDEFMSGLVKVLKPEERFNMSVFYASQKVEPTPPVDARAVQAGREHYQRACRGCHGAQAHGTREVARLAGQHATYLVAALKGYRAAQGQRADARMTGVAKNLSDGQIQELASYLASLD